MDLHGPALPTRAAWVLVLIGTPIAAQDSDQDTHTARVFARFSRAVVEVQVYETGTSAKYATGSGFGAGGVIVTNYHVVADRVLEPARYRLEVVAHGDTVPARVIAVDAVHDLAVLEPEGGLVPALALRLAPLAQGTRLYSLGFPGDLGLSIVEGTYNGLLEHSLQERFHFTGSLNPGMSGGPAITADGRVVGINVSTAGNQLSFLVPAKYAAELLGRARAAAPTPPGDLRSAISRQIHAHQDAYLNEILAADLPTVELGRFMVPTEPAPFFECWGDTYRAEERTFEYVNHQCATDDDLFISAGYTVGMVKFFHRLVRAERWNIFRFYRLYTESFQTNSFWSGGGPHDVTRFRCRTRNVDAQGHVLRAVFCARKLHRLDDLYDVVFKAAALGVWGTGLETTLQLSAVSFENAQRAVRRFVESISWHQ